MGEITMSNNKREAFNFYRSYYDVLKDIDRDEDKLDYLLALLDKQFKGVEPSLKGISKIVYNGQKYSIDKQVEGWEHKTKQKLYDPTEDTTEGGSQGGSVGGLIGGIGHPNLHPTEPPIKDPSNNSVMTTEGGSEGGYGDPYLQEQGKEKEKEQEKEQEQKKLNEKERKQFYINNKVEIEYLISQYQYSLEEAIQVHYNNIRELDKLWVN
jgi:hypothetical protein